MSPLARKRIREWMATEPTAANGVDYWVCGSCARTCSFNPGGVTSCCGHATAYAYSASQIDGVRDRKFGAVSK